MRITTLLMLLPLAVAVNVANATGPDVAVMHVDGDDGVPVPPDFGRQGWGANAYKYLQDALADVDDLFDSYPEIDRIEIWVAATIPGNPYRPDRNASDESGSLDPTATFNMLINTSIYGGFLGLETDLTQRDPEGNMTVLSGDYSLGMVAGSCPAAGDCFVVHATPGCDDQCLGTPPPPCNGPIGACAGCCSIVCGIEAFCCDVEWDDLCVEEACSLCGATAAFHVVTAQGVDATALLDGFTLTGGAALGTSPHDRGGGMFIDGASPRVVRCRFIANNASGNGGGVSTEFSTDEARFYNCQFVANGGGSAGGGVFAESPTAFVNCLLSGNTASTTGGGLSNFGGNGVSLLVNCTLGGNTAGSSGGGVFSSLTAGITLVNCVLSDNQDSTGETQGGQITSLGAETVSFCCVYPGGFGGMGNLNQDPAFLDDLGPDGIPDTGDEDLRLELTSPCNEAGNNGAVPGDMADLDTDGDLLEPVPVDLALHPRFTRNANIEGASPCYIVDMGAFENADCQQNGTRDEDELVGNDADGDGIPDFPCQDCNNNSQLDSVDISMGSSLDCDMNGIPDECDIASGCSTDKNKNGIPDECECTPGAADIVFMVDTSGSMTVDLPAVCTMAQGVVADLALAPHCMNVSPQYLGITELPEFDPECSPFTQTVITLLGTNVVPGNPGRCGRYLDSPESWGHATALIAQLHDWNDLTTRVIVPIADEGACRGSTEGDPCELAPGSSDRQAVENAATLANNNNAFVFPLTAGILPEANPTCVRALADELAGDTGGEAFHFDDVGSYAEIRTLLVQAIGDLAANCADPCACPADICAPLGVGINDLLCLLADWGSCADCCDCPGNIEREIQPCLVGINDLLVLLAAWGPCPSCGQLGGGNGDPSSDLDPALHAIGFADLNHYRLWILDAGDTKVFVSAAMLVAAVQLQEVQSKGE